LVRQSIMNSLWLGLCSTLLASMIALPLAYAAARLKFAGKSALTGLLLVPLLLPPLVGAVGLTVVVTTVSIMLTNVPAPQLTYGEMFSSLHRLTSVMMACRWRVGSPSGR